MTPLLAPVRLRALSGEAAHKVSWLELFFDLIFVAAVAQVAEPLRDHYTLSGAARFSALFTLVWWAWTGAATFATRFDVDDAGQRLLTVVQIFGVAVMAANARDALDSRSTAGFAAAYAALRLLLVAQYVRARRLAPARTLATRYMLGHGLAAALWLTSALTEPPMRFWVWAVAATLDFGTPWLAIRDQATLPPGARHLPERVGLFTLILLGEGVVAVMRGIESQDTWPVVAVTAALSAMTLLFAVWWWYFERVDAPAAQHVRSHADALRFSVWNYAHLPFYLGIVMTGVGLQRLVGSAGRASMARSDVSVLAGAAAVLAGAMAVIARTSGQTSNRATR